MALTDWSEVCTRQGQSRLVGGGLPFSHPVLGMRRDPYPWSSPLGEPRYPSLPPSYGITAIKAALGPSFSPHGFPIPLGSWHGLLALSSPSHLSFSIAQQPRWSLPLTPRHWQPHAEALPGTYESRGRIYKNVIWVNWKREILGRSNIRSSVWSYMW